MYDHPRTGPGSVAGDTVPADQAPSMFPRRLITPVTATGNALVKLQARGAPWGPWVETPPLVPDVAGQAEITPFERTIAREIGHLAEVCHRPRSQLHLVTERVPTHLARRVSPKASAWLAEHTEDWKTRTPLGVVPNHILALSPEADLDIYENRAATRLVDHLRDYLTRRIETMLDIKRLAKQAQSLQGAMSKAQWTAQHRASRLLGDLFEYSPIEAHLNDTLRQLYALDERLRRLQDTPVYRAVPRSPLPATLRRTNILANDQHYRHVGALWRSWVRHGRRVLPSRWERSAWAQFERFGILVVLRALEQFKLTPEKDDATTPILLGARLRLEGAFGNFELCLRTDGWMTLKADDIDGRLWIGTRPLDALPAQYNDTDRGMVFRPDTSLPDSAAPGPKASSRDASRSSQRAAPTHVPAARSPRQAGVSPGTDAPEMQSSPLFPVPISPVDLWSVERTMKAIQRWVLDARFLAYPPRIDLPAGISPDLVETFQTFYWLAFESGSPTSPASRKHESQNAGKRSRKAGSRHGTNGGKPAPHLVIRSEPRHRDDLEKLFKTLRKSSVKKHLAHATFTKEQRPSLPAEIEAKIEAKIEQALTRLQTLRRCPVCQRTAAPNDFHFRGDPDTPPLTFFCECSGCNTRWELRICKNCRRRYGVIDNRSRQDVDTPPIAPSSLPDKDMLAERGSGDNSWICPHCGT